MEVVPLAASRAATTSSLPTLAVPSGATQKRRQRHNDLDELEDELLRIQIRQHFGRADAFSAAASTYARERKYRDKRRANAMPSTSSASSSSASSETAALTGGHHGSVSGDAFDVSSLGAMLFASPRARVRLADAFTLVKRLLWVSDEDMSEEINENDPKVVAGKQFFRGVEAFSMLSENELAQLVGLSELRAYKGGDVVVPDEREADGLYIVLSGAAARFPLPSAADLDVVVAAPARSADEDGAATHESVPRGHHDDEYATESFAYQDHFGTTISPTEAARTERGESAVVATSDELECLWLPELVVRMLNVQPRMAHEFALVLHNPRAASDALQRAQEELLARLLRAGLHVAVLANTRNTTQVVVLLLSAPLWLLAREDKLLAMERVVEHQSAEEAALLEDESYESHAETLSASDRVAAFASILTRPASDKPPGVGLQGIEHNMDAVVKDVFPLHDPSMTDFILSTWFKETHSASTKRLFLLRIKDYFGLRIAFFTAFVRLYNAALVYPLNAGCLLWVFWRWIHYRTYVKALGVYGLGVAFAWAPTFVKRWLRYQNSLLVEWNLLGAKEVALPNLQFKDYVVETVNVAAPHEPPDLVEVKTYDHRRRWPKYAYFALFCFACLVLLFVFVGVYVQWYIIAVMTPMCTDPRCPQFLDAPGGCEAHCHELFALGKNHLFMQHIASCAAYCAPASFDRAYYRCDAPLVGCFATERGILGTARWFYVLLQGVVLGLTLDIVFLALFEAIASGFNAWENYATEQEKETRLVEKIFLFNWVGYFYWFLLLAFLYVPNGAQVQAFIRDHVDSNALLTLNDSVRFSRYWVDGLISMDSAFVTPMIVTQALNLVINTFVPYLLRRAVVRARDSYHVKKERFLTTRKAKPTPPPRHKPGFNSIDVSELSAATETAVAAEGEDAEDDPANAWLAPADLALLDRREVAAMLAQRAPVRAEQLEASARALFRGVSSHESHMAAICGALAAGDLDAHQRTSYDWLDRVTRNLEERGAGLKGLWQASPASDDTGGDGSARGAKLQLITQWQCRNYNYTADRILEESSMPIYSPEGDQLHLAIQFSYTILFSVVWPFCCLCAFARNAVALRFDAIKMTLDCKRPIPRRTIGIGRAWLGALLFEILAAQVIVPGLFVYVSGQLDAFYRDCEISESRYGPAPDAERDCGLGYGARLQAFVALENVGIALGFLIYLKKSDLSHETAIKVVAHSRRLKHHVRKSVRAIGETVLVGVAASPPPQVQVSSRGAASPERPERRRASGRTADLLALDEVSAPDHDDHVGAFVPVDLQDARALAKPVHPMGTLHRRRTQGVLEMAQTRASLDGKAALSAGSAVASAAASSSSASEWPSRTGHVVEWREGTVAWVKGGRLKVNFSGGRQLSNGGADASSSSPVLPYSESEVWLANQETYVIMEPTPVQIFELGMSVLLASRKFGRWHEATVVALDARDRFGKPLAHTPNQMHVKFVEAQNLRTHGARTAALMDPYCVLTVSGAPQVRHASSVKRSTLNPVWDESAVFPLSERELYGMSSGTTSGADALASVATSAPSATASRAPSTAASAASSRHTSHAVLDRVAPTTAASGATLSAAVSAALGAQSQGQAQIQTQSHHHAAAAGVGVGAGAPRRTLKVSVLNNDAFATGECVGEVELDLNQLRDGARHRLLVPLSQKRHIWTLDAVQSVMRKQALGGVHYPMLGLPHLLVELQWVDTRLPTKVAVRLKGAAAAGRELVLSRKFCETNLCYGVDPDRVATAGAPL